MHPPQAFSDVVATPRRKVWGPVYVSLSSSGADTHGQLAVGSLLSPCHCALTERQGSLSVYSVKVMQFKLELKLPISDRQSDCSPHADTDSGAHKPSCVTFENSTWEM